MVANSNTTRIIKQGVHDCNLPKRLALFDTDNTLVDIIEVHNQAYTEAMNIWDIRGSVSLCEDLKPIEYAGRDTRSIIEKLALKKSSGRLEIPDVQWRIEEALVEYNRSLDAQLRDINRRQRKRAQEFVLPGVFDLLNALRDEGVALAVYTGGYDETNRLTLEATGLMEFFPVRIAMDHPHAPRRSQAIRQAVENAREVYGYHFRYNQCVVFGDSVFDISSAQELKIPVVGIYGTGHYSYPDMASRKPDWLYKNLSKTNLILRDVFGKSR